MAGKNRVKLVLHKTSPVTKAAILAAAVLSLVALVALYSSIDHVHSQYDAMRDQAMALESDNEQLQTRIDDLGTLDSALRIAMEELGLTFPGSYILTPGN